MTPEQTVVLEARRRKPRICVISYKSLSRLVHSVIPDYENQADIVVIEKVFDNALAVARDLERDKATDVIISAGANATILRSALTLPVVPIKVTGYDFLLALMKARKFSERVGIVRYRDPIPELEAVKDLLKLEFSQRTYETLDDAKDCFLSLVAEGYRVIIGSSTIVDLAEQSGVVGIMAYSQPSVRQAISDAIEIARIANVESARFDHLNIVLHHLQEAVLAVDTSERITAINPAMERLVGIPPLEALGRVLSDLSLSISVRRTLSSGEEDLDRVVQLNQATYVANSIPIREHGFISGAVLTLQDARVIQRADTNIRTQRRVSNLTARYHFHQIVGDTPAMIHARSVAQRNARLNATVLVTGESGTGKELFAQAIHNASRRGGNPFVPVNCAAFPEPLLESELFGYEEGAFTGSRKGGKPGLFEIAHTGTIFLDEIGDMPISLQSRLLRVLQEKEVVRLGSAQPIPVDCRIIAATHQDLSKMAKAGLFRVDLFYRLNILRLHLPALRERADDIPVLALRMLNAALRRSGSRLPANQVLAPLVPSLRAYNWPGNVRELENIIERLAVALSSYQKASDIDYRDLEKDFPEIFNESLEPAVVKLGPASKPHRPTDPAVLRDALEKAGGRKQIAAKMLGMGRTTLWRRLKAASQG
ncbi:MAG: propionate catabolism operon regulatory protein PrpR [Thermoleophilia bacterium]